MSSRLSRVSSASRAARARVCVGLLFFAHMRRGCRELLLGVFSSSDCVRNMAEVFIRCAAYDLNAARPFICTDLFCARCGTGRGGGELSDGASASDQPQSGLARLHKLSGDPAALMGCGPAARGGGDARRRGGSTNTPTSLKKQRDFLARGAFIACLPYSGARARTCTRATAKKKLFPH